MATQVIEVWDLHVWDGGDRENYRASFSNPEAAAEAAGQHDRIDQRRIIVHESKADYVEWQSGNLRRNALAKLTNEERIVLGLV
ncbi:hypothetical protein [Methyloversatilis sp.]|uniref:hypothetical protein n=1 Tax=Methyloversatilis sp. TaxID=2569862 RepID=UPI0035B2D677